MIGRLFAGIVNGMNASLVACYNREISPYSLMGFASTLNGLVIVLGKTLVTLLGLLLPDVEETESFFTLKLILGGPILTCSLRLIGMMTFANFETPKFYQMLG